MENALTKEKNKPYSLVLFLLPASVQCCYPCEIKGKRSLKGCLKIIEISIQVLGGVGCRGAVEGEGDSAVSMCLPISCPLFRVSLEDTTFSDFHQSPTLSVPSPHTLP